MDTSQNSRYEVQIPDWSDVVRRLKSAKPGPELDAYIDSLASYSLEHQPDTDTSLFISSLVHALERATSPLTCRSVALAIAVNSPRDDQRSVDALADCYRRRRNDSFLAAALLDTLGLLALRDPLARAEATVIVLRLTFNDAPYLLIKGAQVIGRLDNQQQNSDLRAKLRVISQNEDLGVASEAHYQEAWIALADALLAVDRGKLREQLTSARASFERAEAMAELRPDVRVFILLIDIILGLEGLTDNSAQAAEQLAELAAQAHTQFFHALAHVWPGYYSPTAEILAVRCLSVIDTLQRAVLETLNADDWTNLDAALIELATILTLSQQERALVQGSERWRDAFTAIIDVALIPKLGPLLERSVGRRRLDRVIANYRSRSGEDAITERLLDLQRWLHQADTARASRRSSKMETNITDWLEGLDPKSRETFQYFLTAVTGSSREFLRPSPTTPSLLLPIDYPHLYGSDPAVDITMRQVLQSVRERLGSYPYYQWVRFQTVLEKILSFLQYVRNDLPDYTLCKEDGGKGLNSSEHDLQADVFRMLRMEFGRGASYEHSRVGGGRPDTGVGFPDVFFPIEIKHEFKSVEREHIKGNYLTQADLYATATDRIALLLVLDLRESNCAGHRKVASSRRHKGELISNEIKAVSLYRLDQSFWVDGFPTDPQVIATTPNVVVVGLVPGNRTRPSSTTHYSKRPST